MKDVTSYGNARPKVGWFIITMSSKTEPNQVVRKWMLGVFKNVITQTRERRGFTISVPEVFTIFEAHSAEADGDPHTISSMAHSLGVSPSTVSRTISRLEQMHAVKLVPDGKRIFILGDPKWFELYPDCHLECVRSFRQVAAILDTLHPEPQLHG